MCYFDDQLSQNGNCPLPPWTGHGVANAGAPPWENSPLKQCSRNASQAVAEIWDVQQLSRHHGMNLHIDETYNACRCMYMLNNIQIKNVCKGSVVYIDIECLERSGHIWIYTYLSNCLFIYISIYVRTYVCMYVCMYGWMYVCMYVCTYVCMCVCMSVCMYAIMYVCMYVFIYLFIYSFIYLFIYVFMYVRVYVCRYVCLSVCMYVWSLYVQCMYVCMCLCVSACLHVCTSVCMCEYLYCILYMDVSTICRSVGM